MNYNSIHNHLMREKIDFCRKYRYVVQVPSLHDDEKFRKYIFRNDNSKFWVAGGRYWSNSREFVVTLDSQAHSLQKDEEFTKEDLLYRQSLEKEVATYLIDKEEQALVTDNFFQRLIEERVIEEILNNDPTKKEWQENNVTYKLSTNFIGNLCKTSIFGSIITLQSICYEFNSLHKLDPVVLFDDKVSRLLYVPLQIWKSSKQELENYIRCHPTVVDLKDKYISKPVEICESHVYWSAMGLRRDCSYTEGESKPKYNYRQAFLDVNKAIPNWVQEYSDWDDTYGILLTITNYIDVLLISLPGGKRRLGETPVQCCIRELSEELSLDIQVCKSLNLSNYISSKVDVKSSNENEHIDPIINTFNQLQLHNIPSPDTTHNDSSTISDTISICTSQSCLDLLKNQLMNKPEFVLRFENDNKIGESFIHTTVFLLS